MTKTARILGHFPRNSLFKAFYRTTCHSSIRVIRVTPLPLHHKPFPIFHSRNTLTHSRNSRAGFPIFPTHSAENQTKHPHFSFAKFAHSRNSRTEFPTILHSCHSSIRVIRVNHCTAHTWLWRLNSLRASSCRSHTRR